MPGSVASSCSSFSEAAGDDLKGIRPAGDDDVFDEQKAWITGIFGVLYTVSKEKDNITVPFAIFRLFMDWLQLFLLTVNPTYGFNINDKNLAWRIFNFVQLNQFMAARGYAFFLACLYVMVAMLLANVALSAWVGWSFQNNRFDHVWPIKILRYFATIFYQVLDIASMTLFLMTLDCNYFGKPEGVEFYNQEFPDIYCWSMPHLLHVVVASISLIAFILMAGLFTMAEMELNPATRNWMAMGHSKVELIGFVIKVIMTCASVFVTSAKWLSVVHFCMMLMLTYYYLVWVPHYYDMMNKIRIATYFSVLYTAVMLVLVAFTPGVDAADDDAVFNFRKLISVLTWVGFIPAGILGYLAARWRLGYFHGRVLEKYRASAPDAKPKEVHVLRDPREVEILARCCRVWVDVDTLDKDCVKLASKVMKHGLSQLPKEPYMIIVYSSFLIDVELSYQSGYKLLQSAKKANPSTLERFAIFSREQQHTQKAAGGAAGQHATDLVSYVEFQRNYGLAMKVHREALLSMRAFWACLLHHQVKYDVLCKATRRMDQAIKQADRVYRGVLQRHANHVKMVRLYAKFLEGVKHDPWNATRWVSEAEKLEQAEEQAKNNNMLEGLDADPQLRAALTSDQVQERGVVILNAQCQVQMVNQAAQELFGYTKSELHGKNIHALMPSPFAELHNNQIKNYVETGKEGSMLNRWSYVVGLHKERHMTALGMHLTRVSGIGEDAVFMAVCRPMPSPDTMACIWVLPNGKLLGADMRFADLFGHKATDLVGASVAAVLMEFQPLERVIKEREAAPSTWTDPHTGQLDSQLGVPPMPPGPGGAQQGSSHHGLRGRENSVSNMLGWRSSLLGNRQQGGINGSTVGFRPVAVNELEEILNGGLELERIDSKAATEACNLPGLRLFHKYSGEELEVDLHVQHRTTGNQSYYQIQVQCTEPPSRPYMLVTDQRGRVVHVTNALVDLLGANRAVLMGLLPQPKKEVTTAVESVLALAATNATNDPKGKDGPGGVPLEQLLIEPFASLHKHAGPVANPHFANMNMIPPYSCRSGLSVLVPCNTRKGPDATPFRMQIDRHMGSPEEVYNVVSLQPCSLEQAVAERCLTLTLDCLGVVQEVSQATPDSLFGFSPRSLLGQSISSFVDVFQGQDDDLGTNDEAIELLADLLQHTKKHPGSVFNVGVVPPPSEVDMADVPEALMGLLEANNLKPALMSVTLVAPTPSRQPGSGPQSNALSPMSKAAHGPAMQAGGSGSHPHVVFPGYPNTGNTDVNVPVVRGPRPIAEGTEEEEADGSGSAPQLPPPLLSMSSLRLPSTDQQLLALENEILRLSPDKVRGSGGGGGTAGGGVVGGAGRVESIRSALRNSNPNYGPAPVVQPVSNLARSSIDAPGAAAVSAAKARPKIVVKLWRADLLTCVVEVDAGGKVAFPPDRLESVKQLYPAGLLFGTLDSLMLGHTLGRYLDMSSCSTVADLYDALHPVFSSAGSELAADEMKPKSNMKPSKPETRAKVVGPMNLMHTRNVSGLHQELPVTVQAVRKAWPAQGTYLVIHAHHWPCGRPDLRVWIKAMNAAMSHPMSRASMRGLPAGLGDEEGAVVIASQRRNSAVSLGVPPRAGSLPRNMHGSFTAMMQQVQRTSNDRGGPSPVPPDLPQPSALLAKARAQRSAALLGEGPQGDQGEDGVLLPGQAAGKEDSFLSGRKQLDSDDMLKMVQQQLDSKEALKLQQSSGDDAGGGEEEPSVSGSPQRRRGGSPRPEPSGDSAAQAGMSALANADAQKRVDKSGREDLIKAWILSNGSSFLGSNAPQSQQQLASDQFNRASYVSGVNPTLGSGQVGRGNARQAGGWLPTIPDSVTAAPKGVMFAEGEEEEGRRPTFGPPDDLYSQGHDSDDNHSDMASKKASKTSGSDASDGLQDAETFTSENNYRRGRRLKKLLRLLAASQVMARLNRFKIHVCVIVAILMAVHTGMFVLIYNLIAQQRMLLNDLYNISESAEAASDMTITARALNIIYTQYWYPNLRFVSGPQDLPALMDRFKREINYFQEMHTGSYLGFDKERQLPTTNGVRDLWEKPSLNETRFWYISYNESLNNFTIMARLNESRLVSLWDAGNLIIGHCKSIWQNSAAKYNGTYPTEDFQYDTSLLYVVSNYASAVIVGYLKTMDGMVQYIIDNANMVNRTQIIILIMEGVALCLAAVAYTWYLSAKVSGERFKVYHLFMAVPQALVKALATRPLRLDEDEEEEEEAPANAEDGAGGGGDAKGTRPDGGRLSNGGTRREDSGGAIISWGAGSKSLGSKSGRMEATSQGGSLFSMLTFWRKNSVTPAPGKHKKRKRTLAPSAKASWWQVSLFAVWGSLVVVINGVGNSMLAQISSPVATFIILNFCKVLYQRNMYYLQELVFEPDPARMPGEHGWRAIARRNNDELRKEYNVLLFGGQAAPNETAPHYTLVKEGLLFSDSAGSDILFRTTDCLCKDQTECLNETHPLYTWTHNGLDRMMGRYLQLGDTIPSYQFLDPYMNGPVYDYFWNTRPDTTGGWSMLNVAYFNFVDQVYAQVLSIHVTALALTAVIFLTYLLLFMRPFLAEVRNEQLRIAELFTELPSDLDIEGLMQKNLLGASTPPADTSSSDRERNRSGKG